jgi:hypothetical protein
LGGKEVGREVWRVVRAVVWDWEGGKAVVWGWAVGRVPVRAVVCDLGSCLERTDSENSAR